MRDHWHQTILETISTANLSCLRKLYKSLVPLSDSISLDRSIMQSIYLILMCLVLGTRGLTFIEDWPEEHIEADVSDFVDRATPLVAKFIVDNHLDPLKIPDVYRSFWVIPPFLPQIQHKVSLSLSSGSVNRLSTFERRGKVMVKYDKKVMDVDLTIGFDLLYVSYDYCAKILLLNHYGDLDAKANSVEVNVKVEVDLENYRISLQQLRINRIGSITVDIRGKTISRWLITPVTNAILPIFKRTLTRTIQGRVTTELQKFFDELNDKFPPY